MLKARTNPDLILTHYRDDAHQDHRQVFRLTWNTFRDHCVLEYEIPKWDGDLGQPNLYMPVSQDRTAELEFWECRAPECYAEAFFARKLTVV